MSSLGIKNETFLDANLDTREPGRSIVHKNDLRLSRNRKSKNQGNLKSQIRNGIEDIHLSEVGIYLRSTKNRRF